MLNLQTGSHRDELLYCGYCKRYFKARIATWVDILQEPRVRTLLLNWEFNVVACPQCGNRIYSDSSFYYEDLAEGLLVAVFPRIPENRLSVEEHIRQKYSYYPTVEFFYDMTQLWFLIYLQEHYKKSEDPRTGLNFGGGDKRLRIVLQFLKKDPIMLAIRETLMKLFLGNTTNDDLQNVLWRALVKLEGAYSRSSDASVSIGPMVI
jgi:hypothetical protein